MGSYSQRPIIILFAICIVIFCAMLASCATYTKEYHNEEGKTFTCEVEGPLSYGIIVHSMLERCKARALAAGYK